MLAPPMPSPPVRAPNRPPGPAPRACQVQVPCRSTPTASALMSGFACRRSRGSPADVPQAQAAVADACGHAVDDAGQSAWPSAPKRSASMIMTGRAPIG